jgi:ATP-dependent Lon protease
VLVPARNERDLEDIPKDVLDQMKVHLIKRVDQVLPLVLEPAAATSAPPPDGTPSSVPPPPAAPPDGDGGEGAHA